METPGSLDDLSITGKHEVEATSNVRIQGQGISELSGRLANALD